MILFMPKRQQTRSNDAFGCNCWHFIFNRSNAGHRYCWHVEEVIGRTESVLVQRPFQYGNRYLLQTSYDIVDSLHKV